jgi:TRAP-type mannitol/chloroaromatic compound transport system permease small subunit
MAGPGSYVRAERLLGLADLLDRPAVWLGRCGAWLLLPMIVVIAFDVIGRKYVRHLDFVVRNDLHHYINSPKLQDSEWHFSAALILLALGYAFSRNVHIRLDIVRHRLSVRARVWIELIGTLVLLPFLAVLLVHAVEFAYDAWLSGEQSPSMTGLHHRWMIKSVIGVGLSSLIMAALSLVIRLLIWLFGPPQLARRTRLESLTGTAAAGDDPAREARST